MGCSLIQLNSGPDRQFREVAMEAETDSVKTARMARTLDEEIAHQREKLRKLEERQREQQRRER